jgi:CheY-like chemotaxis protein
MIKMILESTGDYDVSVCTQSREALRVIKKLRPDIILIDINMPELSGPELVQQIMADETAKTIPCIFVTGDFVPGEVMGTTRCIMKPFKRPELIALINEVLGEKGNQSMDAHT